MLAVSPSSNRLLAALSRADLGLLQPHLKHGPLKLRQDLERPNRRIDYVYFPDGGFASVVAVQSNNTRVEVGLIGYEGMTGTSILLGSDRTPHSTYIQAAGQGQRIRTLKLRQAMEASKSLRMLLLRYVQVFMVQTAHTAISNARGRLDARLARWILMAHDRVRDETLPLTHEFLSLMLGVRRAGVTETLHSLESQKLIYTGTGRVTLRNRKGMERAAGNSYGTPEAEFRRLIG
ncbi:MAG TPA: Crp/Fnr family transcriptional regulator [Xanthobacteraceae bacterium]